MPYAAIMVYVEADATPEHRVRLAATLAGKFNSMLIGLSALALPPPIVADGMLLDGPTSMDIDLIKAKLADRGKWFRALRAAIHRGSNGVHHSTCRLGR